MAMTCITGGKECDGCMRCQGENEFERNREEAINCLDEVTRWLEKAVDDPTNEVKYLEQAAWCLEKRIRFVKWR